MTRLELTLIALAALVQAALAGEASWLTDFAKAQQLAKEEKKLVLLDFTGSDWCPPCKLLHKNVFSTHEFNDFAKENLVLVLVDFPNSKPISDQQKKANGKLGEKYKVQLLPTIVVLDSNGKQLSFTAGYHEETAKEFIDNLKKLDRKSVV